MAGLKARLGLVVGINNVKGVSMAVHCAVRNKSMDA